MKKEYIFIENGIVTKHEISDTLPKNAIEVKDFHGYVGIETIYLSDDYKTLLTESELIKKGVYVDNRGVYYNKETLQKHEIRELNKEVPEGYTKEIPQTIWDEWDETEQKFIVNVQKLKDYKKSELDREYNSFILSKYSIEKQMKLTMYYNSLLNKQINGTLTTEEQMEKENLENLHRWYKGILQNHENDKLVIESETGIEKIKNFKASLEK